ncbi:MAG: hypothetical protein J5608_03490 [Alphaproteobacteria bacterium]|nr:hypothetical protein [Alphaproteobacteria bacterium]
MRHTRDEMEAFTLKQTGARQSYAMPNFATGKSVSDREDDIRGFKSVINARQQDIELYQRLKNSTQNAEKRQEYDNKIARCKEIIEKQQKFIADAEAEIARKTAVDPKNAAEFKRAARIKEMLATTGSKKQKGK